MMERNPLYGYSSEGKDAVVLRNCRDCDISGLHLHNVINSEAGLTIEKCHRIHLVGCSILDCDNVGLLLKDSAQVYYDTCLIRDDREGAKSVNLRIIDAGGNVVQER
jgi:hypothetical protein